MNTQKRKARAKARTKASRRDRHRSKQRNSRLRITDYELTKKGKEFVHEQIGEESRADLARARKQNGLFQKVIHFPIAGKTIAMVVSNRPPEYFEGNFKP